MTEKRVCRCPYCDEEIRVTLLPFCQACSVVIKYCRKCKLSVRKEEKVCPRCGEPLE